MSDTPEWVTVDDVIALNKSVVQHTGEPHGLAHPGGLESAVNRPQQHFSYGPEDTFDDLVLLGTKLCIGVSESQAFVQGNKRTGFAAMEMFFNLNGHEISSAAHGQIAELILASANPDHSRRLSDDDFADQLDPFIHESSTTLTGDSLVYALSSAIESIGSINISMSKAGSGSSDTDSFFVTSVTGSGTLFEPPVLRYPPERTDPEEDA